MERYERAANLIKKLGAEFLERENNGTSLITVTHADVSPDFRNAKLYITVLPEAKETEALAFAKRQRSDLRDLLKEQLDTKIIPFIDIEIDQGEKNRQKIEALLKN